MQSGETSGLVLSESNRRGSGLFCCAAQNGISGRRSDKWSNAVCNAGYSKEDFFEKLKQDYPDIAENRYSQTLTTVKSAVEAATNLTWDLEDASISGDYEVEIPQEYADQITWATLPSPRCFLP